MKILKIKMFHSQNDLQDLEDEVNDFMEQENLLTQDFVGIEYQMTNVSEGAPPSHHHHYCIVLIYRKEL